MKRFLPLILAAGVLALAGCHIADVPEASVSAEGHAASTEHGTSEPTAPIEASTSPETAGAYPTSSAFPSNTPPSGKESVTALGYWGPRKANTQPVDAHAEGGNEGHGEAPAAH